MPGVRRRLLDVGSRITGVLAAARDEAAELKTEAAVPAVDPVTAPPTPTSLSSAPAPSEKSSAMTAAAPPSTTTATAVAAGTPAADPVCVAAVELARAAAVEVAGSTVGEHAGMEVDDALVVTHVFGTTEKAYRGWHWAVTVARAEDSSDVTVDEVVLLPGSGALVSPQWVPWANRIRPGDLAPGDVLPTPAGDPRLVPAFADPDAFDEWSDLYWELGLGRARVLSVDGRADAAERWFSGDAGPTGALAKAAPGACVGCGFLIPLAGSLRASFGVCANEYAPDDGRVVSLEHGCGAHSEAVQDVASQTWTGMAVEHDELELIALGPAGPHAPGTVEDTDPGEPFGHS